MLGFNLSNPMVYLRYFVLMRFGEYFGLCYLEVLGDLILVTEVC